MLGLILRVGKAGAAALAILAGALTCYLAWTALGALAPVAGLAAGALVYILGRSYVGIVTIITEMLVLH